MLIVTVIVIIMAVIIMMTMMLITITTIITIGINNIGISSYFYRYSILSKKTRSLIQSSRSNLKE